MLRFVALLLRAVFGVAALVTRKRPTHPTGVGAEGTLVVLEDPPLPPHEFFRPGARFRVLLRHATLGRLPFVHDDASADVRSASLKITNDAGDDLLDLPMNTGTASVFTDAWVFLDFMLATALGSIGFAWFAWRHPRQWAVGLEALRRAPSSFAALSYYSQLIFPFTATDGRRHAIRYRLLPAEGGDDSGRARAERAPGPRLAEEKRPKDYLRQELKDRLRRGPVRYRLQAQLHAVSAEDPHELYDTSRTWDETTHPWRDLAIVMVERALDDAVTERLRFNIANHPACLGVLPATSPRDYNSIGHLRTLVYPTAQRARGGG